LMITRPGCWPGRRQGVTGPACALTALEAWPV
jgi:hypothetical protein